jgi:hypothetical protein
VYDLKARACRVTYGANGVALRALLLEDARSFLDVSNCSWLVRRVCREWLVRQSALAVCARRETWKERAENVRCARD